MVVQEEIPSISGTSRTQEGQQGVECQSTESPRSLPGLDRRETDNSPAQSPPVENATGASRRSRRGICAFFSRAKKVFRSGEPVPAPLPAEADPVPGPSGLQGSVNAVAADAERSDNADPAEEANRGASRRGRRGMSVFFSRARKVFRRSGEPVPAPLPAEADPVPGPSGLQGSVNAVAADAERSDNADPDDAANRVSQGVSRQGRRRISAFFKRARKVFSRSGEPVPAHAPAPQPSENSELAGAESATDTAVSEYDASRGNLKDIYAFNKRLVDGSFGMVYKARKGSDWSEVVIKSCSRPAADTYIVMPDHPRPLYREVALLVMLRRPPVCPYVIEMYEWFDGGDSLSIVLEYPQPCIPLKEFIRLEKRLLAFLHGRTIMQQLIQAMQHCISRGVFHNDISLRNILVTVDQTPKIKLIGFNSARVLDEDGYDASTYNGDPNYQPPEVFAMRKYHAVPTYVWFLGVIFYAILKGYLPFSMVHEIIIGPTSGLDSLSPKSRDLLKKCLQRRQQKRPTLEEILEHSWIVRPF